LGGIGIDDLGTDLQLKQVAAAVDRRHDQPAAGRALDPGPAELLLRGDELLLHELGLLQHLPQVDIPWIHDGALLVASLVLRAYGVCPWSCTGGRPCSRTGPPPAPGPAHVSNHVSNTAGARRRGGARWGGEPARAPSRGGRTMRRPRAHPPRSPPEPH